MQSLKGWWSDLCSAGPLFGYFPKPSKTWVIVKPEKYEEAKEAFPELNITAVGHKYLGSYIGSREGTIEFVESKVKEWIENVIELSGIATREPQIAFAAFIYGLSKRWNYVCRTTYTPDISLPLKGLEVVIQESFLVLAPFFFAGSINIFIKHHKYQG